MGQRYPTTSVAWHFQVMLAAVHPWDTHGAKAAGLQTAYIDRDGEEYPPYFLPPDVTVPSFVALAERLQG